MNFLIFFLFCNLAFADQTVYDQIVKNNPKIDKVKAKEIANHVFMVNKKYKIPNKIYAAILMQESMYVLDTVSDTNDYCMAQINIKTIKAFKFDKKKLMTSLKYCIEAGAIVLADFKRMYGHKEAYWYTRYNSGKPSKRKEYLNKISKWIN